MTSKIPDSNCAANPALILCAVSFTKLISVSAIKMTTRVSDSSSGWILLNTLLRVLCKKEKYIYCYVYVLCDLTRKIGNNSISGTRKYKTYIRFRNKNDNEGVGFILRLNIIK